MLVLHANWTDGALRIWGESLDAYLASSRFESQQPSQPEEATSAAGPPGGAVTTAPRQKAGQHPFACGHDELAGALASLGVDATTEMEHATIRVRVPSDDLGPWPSDRLSRRVGPVDAATDPHLDGVEVPASTPPNAAALELLLRLEQHGPTVECDFGHSLRYWIGVGACIADLLANQRFIPSLMQTRNNGLIAAWQLWLHDEDVRGRIGDLVRVMPPIARAGVDHHQHQSGAILDEAMRKIADATIRAALASDRFIEAIEDRDPASDPHVAWLTGLLDWPAQIAVQRNGEAAALVRDASLWVSRLDDRAQDRPFHLCLELNEPGSADEQPIWRLSFYLQSPDNVQHLISAAEIWSSQPAAISPQHAVAGTHQELLLAELGRASRIYSKIEDALAEKHPVELQLSTAEAYEFLRDVRPVLAESGISIIAPDWWDQPLGRLAARLHIDAPSVDALDGGGSGTSPAASLLGLNSLVKYQWQIAIGDQPLTMEEFNALADQSSDAPLIKVRGQWIEISPEQLAEAREFLSNAAAGEMTLLEAIHLAHGQAVSGAVKPPARLPVFGLDATGWVADFLGGTGEDLRMPVLEQPRDFHGDLRPYQRTGLSWLAFLDRFGLGACLADDMGLGKTIQLIALLLHERQTVADAGAAAKPGPTLLVVPTSVISNWVRELQRFAPSLTAHVQHGPDRPVGDRFVEIAARHDLVITTYPLVSRDVEVLQRVDWHRVALDEAQYIKNPPTKQTTAIRSLRAPHRLALTGTPVENRLSELWSIMEFCNPGYLGPAQEFRRRFGVPIERHRNRLQADRLRHMVRPFVLRRVKTDPKVIDDLPPLTETKEYATLTVDQAKMYQDAVNEMLGQVDRAAGIQRRGLVLATLVKLKQICNHPDQVRASSDDRRAIERRLAPSDAHALSSRSGKARRLIVMLEEVIASGEKALIFTQFRQMGHLLTAMIQNELDCESLFLHGGTPAKKRQALIDRFQSDSGGSPIFVLSLKAGGLGLNLTAATHVFHFDRWWNPAVENQATDRAFRIGQLKAVQVHKFVCLGTLEERIDQMIEQKTDLAQNIIGSGEQWLTELSTNQLHELLMLRPSAMEGES